MRRVAGRMQTVGAGVLALAVTVAAPALSAAQDPGAVPSPPPATPALPTPPPEPDPPAGGDAGEASQDGTDEQVASQATATATAPRPQEAPQGKAKASASKTVSVGDNFYSPPTISISVGDTVTWKNNGQAVHSATADDDSFDTGTFDPGQSRSETFTTAGTVNYFCTVHGPVQSGTIRVLSASGGGGGSGGSSASSGGGEAAAVASSDAAGSSTSLPSTGFAAIGLAVIGLVLLGSGTALRRLDPESKGRLRSISIY